MAGLLGTVTAFQTAVRQHDEDAQDRALQQLRDEFDEAPEEDLALAGSLLADCLNSVPAGRDAVVAVLIGAFVERGANAADCAEPVLHRAQLAIEGAVDFCRRWPGTTGTELPAPTGDEPPAELFDALGGDDPGVRAAVFGWWSLPLWESAVPAVLSRKDVRSVLLPKPATYELAREVVAASGTGTFLAKAFAVLDDAPLVVIHRESRQGFECLVSGIADNAQLHTLLADRLVTPGHLPGTPPSPEAVASCLGSPGAPCEYVGTSSFDLVAPDGIRLPHDGLPIDIPVVDDTRLLVLDPPPPAATWPAARAFPWMAADLTVVRRISDDGVGHWLGNVSPAVDPYPAEPAEPPETRRHWWRRESPDRPVEDSTE